MHPSPVHSPDALAAPQCPRRRASISYNPPPRDRSNKQRPLVVVIPPSILLHQFGLLGHTLSTGPSQRLANGIVMPLYPTMYAQLTAIAREFNFPSTVGICLYLHHSDSAFTVTPRISDETWHSLWCSAFDGSPPPARVPAVPIFGTIEFDVDLRYARWYPSWISSSQRDIPDSASDYHRRVDSRTTIYDERADDRRETYMHHHVPSVSSQRHFPKKLSLLENINNTKMSLQSSSPSPEKPFALAQVLPTAQESEPRVARQDLRMRVQSWRASAILEPSPISTAGQSSLEPGNALKIEVPSSNILIPEDYSWSITSAGPDDRESVNSVGSERLPSVYIEDRLVGSVCSTPSVCTSFGPFDYGFDSPTRGTHILPSLDLAQRAIRSVPMTPMTATTWRSENDDCRYPHFNIYPAIYPFFDLYPAAAGGNTSALPLAKNQSSASHATSMIQSSHYPYFHIYPIIYPFFDLYPAVAGESSLTFSSRMDQITADHAISSIQGSSYPYLHIYPAVYPFFHLYPAVAGESSFTSSSVNQSTTDHATSTTQGFHYPYLQIYPAVYPFFDLYPAVAGENSFASSYVDHPTINHAISITPNFHYAYLQIYPVIYPFFDLYPAVAAPSSYISSCMDQGTIDHAMSKMQGSQYPYLQIYPAIYPFFDLYPAVFAASSYISSWMDQSTIDNATSKIQSSQYPYLRIYPAIYPFLDIYPAIAGESSSAFSNQNTVNRIIAPNQSWHYPHLNIYRPVYPFFDLYPALTAESSTAFTSFTEQNSGNHAISDTRGCQYPYLSIYPAIYPFSELYLIKAGESSSASLADGGRLNRVIPFTQKSHYPYLNIYPAVYPFFDLYPALTKGSSPVSVLPIDHTSVDHATQNCHYPYLNISIDTTSTNRAVSTTLQEYPSINLYPSCYPFLDIYPSTLQIIQLSPRFESKDPAAYPFYPSINSQPPALVEYSTLSIYFHSYPVFDLYPAVYPHFDLYPAVARSNPSRTDVKLQCNDPPSSNYPAPVIYRPAYPHFDLYPSIIAEAAAAEPIVAHLKPTYPFIDIYPLVYPHLKLYPVVDLPNLHPGSTQYPPLESYPDVNPSIDALSPARLRFRYTRAELQERSEKLRRKKSHQDLHFTVFPDGFVSTPSGTVQPLVKSYIVPDTNDFTSLFKAALQVQVINSSS